MRMFILLLPLLAGQAAANEPHTFDYRTVSPADVQRVLADWRARDLGARNVTVIQEEDRDGFRLIVLRHDVSSRAHFGAILLPDVEDLSAAPVVVLPDGLEQYNPRFDLDLNIRKYQSLDYLKGYVKILPAFRGRFMSYADNGWYSRGDFCDAYDGPTDDSIAMLNAAEELLPEVDFTRVLVWGGSRGGNTALLMAARDPRVHTVIAIAAPVDFYRQDWQVEGSNQYRCQFFDGVNEPQSRHRMLASSPSFFPPHENLERVFLHHDEGDDVVPVWNAERMAAHMETHSVDVTKHVYPTQGHGALAGEETFWRNIEAEITAFPGSIDN